MRARLALAGLALTALACNTLLPSPTPPPPAATSTASRTPRPPASRTPRPNRTATPQAFPTLEGVRLCEYVPGASVPAQMPAAVLAAYTPTPYPTSTQPAASAVDAETTAQQLRVFESLWQAVDTGYVYADFNGRDWDAIGWAYRARIRAGLAPEDFYGAMNTMLEELGDEHSYFESPEEAAEADSQFAGQNDYVGIGILVAPIPDAGGGVILLTFPGGPAADAGLKAHDLIVAVDGAPLLDEAGGLRELIRGPEGTQVSLSVLRPGVEAFDLTLTRARITGALPIDYCLIPGTRLGYLFLPNLDDETLPDQVRAALEALTRPGPLAGLVLDNRQNTGGASTVLEALLGLFTSGTVGHFVSREESRALEILPEDVGGSQTVPLVVLVGPDTVSFGEVMSGVLQATGRARLVGQTTLGNVETLWGHAFEDGSRAWIAQETFEPLQQPNGVWEETGIIPDLSAPVRWDLFSEASDPALAIAVQLLQQP